MSTHQRRLWKNLLFHYGVDALEYLWLFSSPLHLLFHSIKHPSHSNVSLWKSIFMKSFVFKVHWASRDAHNFMISPKIQRQYVHFILRKSWNLFLTYICNTYLVFKNIYALVKSRYFSTRLYIVLRNNIYIYNKYILKNYFNPFPTWRKRPVLSSRTFEADSIKKVIDGLMDLIED